MICAAESGGQRQDDHEVRDDHHPDKERHAHQRQPRQRIVRAVHDDVDGRHRASNTRQHAGLESSSRCYDHAEKDVR